MRFVFVDGYNVVNSWDILKKEKSVSLESARQKLIDILDNYGAINGCKVILVFDGYKVAGNRESKYEYNKNLMVIFTKDGVTADAYIDPSVMNYAIQAVAGVVRGKNITEQAAVDAMAEAIYTAVAKMVYIHPNGLANEFYNLVFKTNEDIKHNSKKVNLNDKNVLLDNIDDDVLKKLEAMRRS